MEIAKESGKIEKTIEKARMEQGVGSIQAAIKHREDISSRWGQRSLGQRFWHSVRNTQKREKIAKKEGTNDRSIWRVMKKQVTKEKIRRNGGFWGPGKKRKAGESGEMALKPGSRRRQRIMIKRAELEGKGKHTGPREMGASTGLWTMEKGD